MRKKDKIIKVFIWTYFPILLVLGIVSTYMSSAVWFQYSAPSFGGYIIEVLAGFFVGVIMGGLISIIPVSLGVYIFVSIIERMQGNVWVVGFMVTICICLIIAISISAGRFDSFTNYLLLFIITSILPTISGIISMQKINRSTYSGFTPGSHG